MQSIFTFDHDPPRVHSPWRAASVASSRASKETRSAQASDLDKLIDDVESVQFGSSNELAVNKLDAEPQDGPTEYKVHLLLRPRRTFFVTSNAKSAAGSQHARSLSFTPRTTPDQFVASSSPVLQPSNNRQHRLEQLTTQLLWRLQQSSPFHASSANNIILPTFPEASGEMLEPKKPAKLLPGLEESNGALYEIGVSDDGTFVGLTREEMHESLNNLQAMAACLGCTMEVLRMVKVGEADCVDNKDGQESGAVLKRTESLWVAEAYIKPLLDKGEDIALANSPQVNDQLQNASEKPEISSLPTPREQARITLTGATMSGKSSLLGTLSISTLDNGRGKSRLSLLKHRHEIASGMTSSVTQELIGYQEESASQEKHKLINVINYATSNVSSWTDIHARSRDGRLAFVSDSAGHPRYRRTTVRGLLGWAPHWTMLCVPASNSADLPNIGLSTHSENGNALFAGASTHISMAQLDLCLRLRLPLVIVVTKLDVASKSTFRQILSSLLSSLKSAGRKPIMLGNDNADVSGANLQRIPQSDNNEVKRVVGMIQDEGLLIVPIVFTSAIKGTGICKVHALLRQLPLDILGYTPAAADPGISSTSIFHIDEVYKLSLTGPPSNELPAKSSLLGSVLSGRLAHGDVSVGQELLLGPFSAPIERVQEDGEELPPSHPDDPFLAPRSFTDALARVTAPPSRIGTADSEWRRVRVVSIRNLRLPVQTLAANRVGTIGIVPLDYHADRQTMPIRRGMILASNLPDATHTLTASFSITDASSLVVGNRVVIYSASVRSSAKVVAVALRGTSDDEEYEQSWQADDAGEEPAFVMDDEDSLKATRSSSGIEEIMVTLQLDSYREWIEIGSKLLVMPGGGPGILAGDRGIKGLAGLDGYVGQVIETFG